MSLKAITFDIWETIFVDGSDEPKRAAQGMRSKRDERRHLFWSVLNDQAPLDKAFSDAAFDVHEAAFRKVWHSMSVTWAVADRIDLLLEGLTRTETDLMTYLENFVADDTEFSSVREYALHEFGNEQAFSLNLLSGYFGHNLWYFLDKLERARE